MYVIDRFESNWAVVETEDRQTFNLPRFLLPAGAKEGDVINISVAVDQGATNARRERISNKIKNFFDE